MPRRSPVSMHAPRPRARVACAQTPPVVWVCVCVCVCGVVQGAGQVGVGYTMRIIMQ